MTKRFLHTLLRHIRRECWRIVPNRIASIHLIPGPLRAVILRLAGLDIRTGAVWGGCHFESSHVSLAPGVFVNVGAFFEGIGQITIGEGTLLGPEVMILTSHHALGPGGTPSKRLVPRPVSVGAACWIGARSILLPGVHIADHITVAAGAVVTSSLTEPGVYAGAPARLIRSFMERTIG